MSQLQQLRTRLPAAARQVTQFACDNPGQVAAVAAGLVVARAITVNLVRPRTAPEAIAAAVLLGLAVPYALRELIYRGALRLTIRPDGEPVDAREWMTGDGPDSAAAAP